MKNNRIIIFLVTYFIKSMILGIIDFSYNPFSDEFSFTYLILDLGTWIIVYTAVDLIFSKLSRKKDKASKWYYGVSFLIWQQCG